MVVDNVKRFERIRKLIKVSESICMCIQIIFVLIIFLCTLHIVFGILHNHALDFLNPFIELLKSFTTMMFGEAIKQNQDGVDGREVLFILFTVLVVFFVSQLKLALNSIEKTFQRKIVEEKAKVEVAFNDKLKQELQNQILAQSSFVLALQFKIKWLMKGSIGEASPTTEEMQNVKMEAISRFFESMKTFGNLKFSRDNDILIIASDNIDDIDNVLNKVLEEINKLKVQYKEKKYGIRVKLIVDSCKKFSSVNSVYKNIVPLLGLNATNEILCYGNFKNRYELIKNTQYYVAVKGKYEMMDDREETVFSIIKKD